jgi:hypothetical protein
MRRTIRTILSGFLLAGLMMGCDTKPASPPPDTSAPTPGVNPDSKDSKDKAKKGLPTPPP